MMLKILIYKLFIFVKLVSCVIISENKNLDNNIIYPKTEDVKLEQTSDSNFHSKSDNISLYQAEYYKPVRYDGAQLWRILINDEKERNFINKLKEEFDGETWMDINNNVDLLLKENKLEGAEIFLSKANLSHIVIIDDLQKAIETENPPKKEIEILQNRKGHRLTWIAYHRSADIHSYLDYLAKTYPSLCSVEIIGYSSQNRPLKLLTISNRNPKNQKIFIDGGIHAREWISPATVTYIIEALTENWDSQPAYIRNIDWHILPVVNPDGYEHTHQYDRLWRKNRSRGSSARCIGVDLNRNFGYSWGGAGTSNSGCSDIYRGSRAFSEPESAAMANYMMRLGKGYFAGYITFHSYGQYVLYPWGHKRVLPPDHKDLERVGRQGAAQMLRAGGVSYTVGSSATTLYPASGGSDDWAKAALDIKYTFTVEMRDTGRHGFVLPAQYIITSGKEGLAFTETVAKAISELRKSG